VRAAVYMYNTQRVYIYFCEEKRERRGTKFRCRGKSGGGGNEKLGKRREQNKGEAKQSVNNAHYPESHSLIQKRLLPSSSSHSEATRVVPVSIFICSPRAKKNRDEGFQKPAHAEEFQKVDAHQEVFNNEKSSPKTLISSALMCVYQRVCSQIF
jgi:hypothetical protein